MANEFIARNGVKSLGGFSFPYSGVGSSITLVDANYLVVYTGNSSINITLPTSISRSGKVFIVKNGGAISQ